MSVHKFDATPTSAEAIDLGEITTENVKQAWSGYENKPEYKKFNKHDLIESLQESETKEDQD